ncbi:uncharacterized protein [Mobula birostris]|uniref:uncharacterized protein n=1 Tax=Mobula birostris TaxID=1983395 RepID=UPI003B284B02
MIRSCLVLFSCCLVTIFANNRIDEIINALHIMEQNSPPNLVDNYFEIPKYLRTRCAKCSLDQLTELLESIQKECQKQSNCSDEFQRHLEVAFADLKGLSTHVGKCPGSFEDPDLELHADFGSLREWDPFSGFPNWPLFGTPRVRPESPMSKGQACEELNSLKNKVRTKVEVEWHLQLVDTELPPLDQKQKIKIGDIFIYQDADYVCTICIEAKVRGLDPKL